MFYKIILCQLLQNFMFSSMRYFPLLCIYLWNILAIWKLFSAANTLLWGQSPCITPQVLFNIVTGKCHKLFNNLNSSVGQADWKWMANSHDLGGYSVNSCLCMNNKYQINSLSLLFYYIHIYIFSIKPCMLDLPIITQISISPNILPKLRSCWTGVTNKGKTKYCGH